jgi:hypothetical protein
MEDNPAFTKELITQGIEMQTKLIALGMDEVEIMNFWDECYKAALKNKKKINTPETTLKAAAEEIKEVLRKHNIAAAVALHSPGHGEYFVHLNPSYSCAYMYQDNEVRFYSKKEDYKTPTEQLEKQADTANMLKLLTDITAFNFGCLDHLSKQFDELTGAKHF